LSGYQLLDFGDGRKLESLCGYVVDRPSPAAEGIARCLNQRVWESADAVYSVLDRRWMMRRPWPKTLMLDTGLLRLPFRPTPFGHIGCFPEQLPQWSWLSGKIQAMLTARPGSPPPQCLNLFAHTGGSTLAMAASGGAVTHVDAAKPSVVAAKQVVEANQLASAAVRYLVEDAPRYAARELRRGRSYDLIVLDPPGYGHAPNGKTWRIQRDVWPLIDDCLRLLQGPRSAMLVTAHSVSPSAADIMDYLRDAITQNRHSDCRWGKQLQIDSGRSQLIDSSRRALDAGYYVRATW